MPSRRRTVRRSPGKKRTGRPPIEVNEQVVRGMASVGATAEEIAEYLGVGAQLIRRRFSAVLAQEHAWVKKKLRQWQLRAAKMGNPALLIWLGKQMLGQTEPIRVLKSEVPDPNAPPKGGDGPVRMYLPDNGRSK